MTLSKLDKLQDLRGSDGKLPEFAWPGGYPVMYLASDNANLCPKCANEYNPNRDSDDCQPVAYYIHYEGQPESAYGDPDAEVL